MKYNLTAQQNRDRRKKIKEQITDLEEAVRDGTTNVLSIEAYKRAIARLDEELSYLYEIASLKSRMMRFCMYLSQDNALPHPKSGDTPEKTYKRLLRHINKRAQISFASKIQ